ncbi:STM4012 family radical SAM protein [Actinoplanes derwentensis]|uniref:Heme chaperone HemW n=1 Tax=Actinoplanes derwentensis TaxID=113562 RepID=A0A1H1SK77_9ACTN|nr:STM4012 family radical SAM protein [Actinoplanes derwentensis]GID83279.1 coproporphyrinogen III oxidase [Actinoplanes derwentensis]SDS48407.1 oxygen-independent coproporphyrinogen-3 oxidase [Actinoplanes derwentensis]
MNLDDSPYQGYLYAYPHKTAYRRLEPRPTLADVWGAENQDSLFGYVHLPFCEMRCGFCNLFTRANPPEEQVTAYLTQLRRQASAVRDSLSPGAVFSRVAIGGGTPTYLTAPELETLFGIVHDTFGAAAVPLSVETSPATATPDRLAVLAEHRTTRISMGVQSFLDAEAHAAGRPQRLPEVLDALQAIRDARIPVLNIDLIYGIDGQTPASWQHSLDEALRWQPEELYLYPLYVRPLTGLGRRAHARADWDRQRQELYQQAVDVLTGAGYVRHSMRQFRRAGAPEPDGPDYCCQDDGMIGLGCGARSYTTSLHYSFDYAVAVSEVRAVIDDYLSRPADDFRFAEIGFHLDAVEQRRRWLLKSLLRAEGVDAVAYRQRFGTTHDEDFPQLAELESRGWLDASQTVLTPAGLAQSDAIGPWLVSGSVREAMTAWVAR